MNNDNNQIKYFGYCRKSSEDDSRQVLSLPAQKKDVQEVVEANHLKVLEIYAEAKSAKSPGRELLNKMLDRIQKGDGQGIICWKLDRLARNFIDGGRIIDMLQRGVIREIRTHERTYLPTDNVLMMSVELGMANQFIRDLSTNTKRGLRLKAAMGQPPRFANLGYKNNLATHNWEPDPVRAPYIAQMFEWYDSGQYSELQIVEKLTSAGFRTRYGNPIGKSLVGRTLRSPVYYGYFYDDGELKKGSYEPLITKEVWDRVQDRLDGRVTYNHKKTKLVFKYKGLLHCPDCGCSITAERQLQCICINCKNKFSMKKKDLCPDCGVNIKNMKNPAILDKTYYRCTKSKGKGSCSQPFILEEDLEPQLLKIFEEIKLNKSDIEDVRYELIALYEKDQQHQAATLKNLKTELTKLEEEKQRIFKKLLLSEVEGDDREMAFELKQSMTLRINAIKAQIDLLSDNSYSWLEQSSNVLKLINKAPELFMTGSQEQKTQLVNFVASNLFLSDKKVLYEYNKPFASMIKIKSKKAEQASSDLEGPIWLRG